MRRRKRVAAWLSNLSCRERRRCYFRVKTERTVYMVLALHNVLLSSVRRMNLFGTRASQRRRHSLSYRNRDVLGPLFCISTAAGMGHTWQGKVAKSSSLRTPPPPRAPRLRSKALITLPWMTIVEGPPNKTVGFTRTGRCQKGFVCELMSNV